MELLAGIDLTGLLGALSSVVIALIGWAATWFKKKAEADAAKSKTEQALLKVASLAVAISGKAWGTLSPTLQQVFADGKMTDDERKLIENVVQAIAKEVVSEANLEELAKALGLPMAGLVSKIAAIVIEKWAFAHDPDILTASPLQYPVGVYTEPDPTRNDPGV